MKYMYIMTVGLLSFFYFFCKAVEVRAIVANVRQVRTSLSAVHGVLYKGSYSFCDHIYFPQSSVSELSYARIRVYTKSGWQHKQVVLTIKAVTGKVLFKGEYDAIDDARVFLDSRLAFAFKFFRQGWEYALNEIHLFVEQIEGLPDSVEVIAHDRADIDRLFSLIGIEEILEESIPLFFKSYHDL